MIKYKLSLLFLLIAFALHAQNDGLPLDLRQHNLTDSNSSIFNPASAVNYGNTQSIGIWTRWQWQMIDGDPTTFFLNYTGKLNTSSSIGAGFYQHNTDVYLNTGGVLNYAYRYDFNYRTSLTFGLNLFGYQQEFSGNPFQGDPQIELPLFETTNDFILQFAPGIQFAYDGLRIGFASENMFDYNMSEKEAHTTNKEKIYSGTASYDIPVSVRKSDSTSVLRPMLYIKSIPGFDTQVGVSAFLSSSKFWAQAGYNSFYGIGVGGGGRFKKRFSIGALVEFGTNADLKGKDPTFEFVTAYDFGTFDPRKKVVGFDVEEEEEEEELEEIAKVEGIDEELPKTEMLAQKREAKEREKAQRIQTRDSLALLKKEDAIAAQIRKEHELRMDSINRVKRQEEEALAQVEKQKQLDSINKAKIAADFAEKEKESVVQVAQQAEEEKPKVGQKYEEVVGEDGLIPGYYLIANVFGTKKYLDAFMANLTKKGLQPKSFFRSKDKYNYVYLERYDTMDEARKARDSKLNGRYADKLSIYTVEANDSLSRAKKEAVVAANLRKDQERKTDSISQAKEREDVALARISKQRRLDSITAVEKENALTEANKRREQVRLDSIKNAKDAEIMAEALRKEQQRKIDSINKTKVAAETAAKEGERLEELAPQSKEDKPKAGEKYEEVVEEDGLKPGYYLIANVFGTKRYFDAFMTDLTKKGLQPKSFLRSKNKFNYVYLDRYDTMGEARRARDSKFNGKYPEKTWIYRVVAK
ncbi:MAG: PorP/SprF family type IX secretion system membrane protein [Maribacter sp.]